MPAYLFCGTKSAGELAMLNSQSFRSVMAAGCAMVAMAGIFLGVSTLAKAADTLNVLTWCDHEDPTLLGPFEQANNVKINFKDIDSTAAALAVLGQSKPGDWDVLVVDETDTGRLAKMGLLQELTAKDYPFADIPTEIADPKLTMLFRRKAACAGSKVSVSSPARPKRILRPSSCSISSAPKPRENWRPLPAIGACRQTTRLYSMTNRRRSCAGPTNRAMSRIPIPICR